MFQFNAFSVKNGISEVTEPVADNGSPGVVAGCVLHGLVLVTENEEVDARVEQGLLLRVLVKPCLLHVVIIAALHLVFQLFQSVIVRPFQG